MALLASAASAQNVTVIGPITPGDCPQFSSTTVIKDGGFNCNGTPTIPTNSITNSNLAQMPANTVKANPTGSTANAQDWAINASNSVQGTGINGLDGQQFFIYSAPTTPATLSNQTFRADRNVNYTGGTIGNVYNSIWANTTVGANVSNFEWALLGQVNNSATGGQNVAVAGFGRRMTSTTGPTWGVNGGVDDFSGTANPPCCAVGSEIDLFANGTDSGATRIILDLAGGKHGGTGTTPTITFGWRVGAQAQVLANATFVHGGYFAPATYTELIKSDAGVSATNGIDFSAGTFSGSPFKSTGFSVDGSGNIAANNLTTAWTTFTPSPACGNATFTTTAAHAETAGKWTRFSVDITISNVGTTCNGAANVSFTLPNTTAMSAVFVGRDTAGAVGSSLTCAATGSTSSVACVRFDGTNTWATNDRIIITGSYENL